MPSSKWRWWSMVAVCYGDRRSTAHSWPTSFFLNWPRQLHLLAPHHTSSATPPFSHRPTHCGAQQLASTRWCRGWRPCFLADPFHLTMSSTSLASRQRRRRTLFSSAVLVGGLACLSYAYYRYLLRRRVLSLRVQQLRHATELSDFFPSFYALFEQLTGGCLTTASVHSAQLVDGQVVLFCSGGWANLPPSVYPLPHFAPPLSRPSSTSPPLPSPMSLYWLSRSLGKSLVWNASFALFLSLLLLRHRSSSSPPALTHRCRPILSLSLHIGHYLPPSSSPPIRLVCELATLSPSLLSSYHSTHLFPPDLSGPDLALTSTFGTQHIAAHTQRTGHLPPPSTPGLSDVVWQQAPYPRGKDVWLSVVTDEGRWHVNLAEAEHGWEGWGLRPSVVGGLGWEGGTVVEGVREHRPDLLEYAPPHASVWKGRGPVAHPVPRLMAEEEWRGMGGSVDKRVDGGEGVMRWVQDEVLLNDRPLSVEYVQVEAVVREACNMRGLPTSALYRHNQHSRSKR